MPPKLSTRNASEQSAPAGQPATEGPAPNKGESWRTAQEALKTGLEAAMIVVDGLEIPAAGSALKGVMLVFEQIATMKENAETLRNLRAYVDDLRKGVLEPLEKVKAEYIPPDLKDSVENLAIELEKLMQPWKERFQRKRSRIVSRFVTTKKDRADLADLALKVQAAINKFMAIDGIDQRLELAKMARSIDTLLEYKYFEDLKKAAEKFYNYDERTEVATPLLNETRDDVVKKIKAWVDGTDGVQPHVFWLNGMAGVGKSSISLYIAEWAKAKGILGASLFFDRPERPKHPNSDIIQKPNPREHQLFPALAHELATSDKAFRLQLAHILSNSNAAAERNPVKQFEQLVCQPWQAAAAATTTTTNRRGQRKTCLVVLDVVDELRCADDEDVEPIKNLLDCLLTRPSSMPGNFLVFIASRPEAHIREAFAKWHGSEQEYVLHNVEDAVVQRDIDTFLRHRLADLKEGMTEAAYDGDVPGVAKDCGHIFLYANEVVRFVKHLRGSGPSEQLKRLVRRPLPKPNPYMALDGCYLRVLQRTTSTYSGDDHAKLIQQVIATMVILRDPLPIPILAKFLDRNREHGIDDKVRRALDRLHSIIMFSKSDLPRPLHRRSFSDFITDKERCTDPRFQVNTQEEEIRMCLRCFEIMASELEDTMVTIQSKPDLRDIQPGEWHTIDGFFSPWLQYACKFWAAHLERTAPDNFTRLNVPLRDFMQDLYTHWEDAMGWLRKVGKLDREFDSASTMMVHIIKWMEKHNLAHQENEKHGGNVFGLLRGTTMEMQTGMSAAPPLPVKERPRGELGLPSSTQGEDKRQTGAGKGPSIIAQNGVSVARAPEERLTNPPPSYVVDTLQNIAGTNPYNIAQLG